MKKIVVKLLLFIIGVFLVISPFGIFALIANNQPHVYSKTYYAALVDKVNYLKSLRNEKKIVLIGGSNVAFGFDSKRIEEEYPEYKVVNFGLYAMLGTKIMMDLAVEYIGENDLVFIIPEINSQSTSLFFNSTSTLKAIEDDMSLMWKLKDDNKKETIGSIFSFVAQRGQYSEIIEPSGVYQRKNFNKYGDIFYDEKDENGIPFRQSNRMPLHFDPSMMVDYSYTINQDFFDYLNDYNSTIVNKKAKLYYGFSPANSKSVIEKETAPIDYYWQIRNHLSFPVVGNPFDYIIDDHYFYDSNFHLNDSGALYRTNIFIQDIARDILKSSDISPVNIPEAPDYPKQDTYEDNGFSDYYEYSEMGSDYCIAKVVDKHISETSLTTSSIYNKEPVRVVLKDAFSGCNNLESIVITNNISVLQNGAFNGTPSLKSIYLTHTDPSTILVDYQKGLFEDKTEVTIYVPSSALNDFLVDYNWTNYSEFLKGY